MANTRTLRRRIRSIKNTSQITKAMQMVAATKMRKAQNQALAGRPYSDTLRKVILKLTGRILPEAHFLLKGNSAQKSGILVLSTDKSLCGALNTNLFRSLQIFQKEVKETLFYSVGKKGRNFIIKTGKNLIGDFENAEIITFRMAAQMAKLIAGSFLAGEIKEAYIAYPHFISTLRQEPRIEKLLPLDKSFFEYGEKVDSQESSEYIFEPNADDLLEYVLAHAIETKIYQALLETKASEHSARMIAMQNATENAKELVEDLQLAYNQTRQEGITRELLEITSAQAALE